MAGIIRKKALNAGEGGSAPSVRRQSSGIKRRWIVNNMSIVALLLAAMFIMGGAFATNYYYDSLYNALQSRANTSANNFTTYMSATYNEFYRYAQQQVTEFSDKSKMEMQVLDSNGLIISSSTGLVAGTAPAASDVKECIETGKLASFTGYDPRTEERIMAVTAPVFRRGGDALVGEVRFVSSLKLLDSQVSRIYMMLAGAALAELLLITVTNQFFIHSIVNPVLKINELAQKIAQGQYGARLDMDFRDEMGELCNTINNMSTEIARMEKLKNDFISSVSHELRTPLTAINGWGETILEDLSGDPVQLRRGLRIIVNESRRLSNMVEELLEFSKMEDGRFTLRVEEVDLQAELEDAIFTYQELFRQEGITLEYAVGKGDFPPIPGDSERLKQVFCNVLDNASKHGGAGGRIVASISREAGQQAVRVRDFGPGIPEAELPFIKQKFYKGSSKARGSGIGLAVCDEIVKLHGGTFTIGNAIGGGAEVVVSLPEKQ